MYISEKDDKICQSETGKGYFRMIDLLRGKKQYSEGWRVKCEGQCGQGRNNVLVVIIY